MTIAEFCTNYVSYFGKPDSEIKVVMIKKLVDSMQEKFLEETFFQLAKNYKKDGAPLVYDIKNAYDNIVNEYENNSDRFICPKCGKHMLKEFRTFKCRACGYEENI